MHWSISDKVQQLASSLISIQNSDANDTWHAWLVHFRNFYSKTFLPSTVHVRLLSWDVCKILCCIYTIQPTAVINVLYEYTTLIYLCLVSFTFIAILYYYIPFRCCFLNNKCGITKNNKLIKCLNNCTYTNSSDIEQIIAVNIDYVWSSLDMPIQEVAPHNAKNNHTWFHEEEKKSILFSIQQCRFVTSMISQNLLAPKWKSINLNNCAPICKLLYNH